VKADTTRRPFSEREGRSSDAYSVRYGGQVICDSEVVVGAGDCPFDSLEGGVGEEKVGQGLSTTVGFQEGAIMYTVDADSAKVIDRLSDM
jgi:hypothetical protein